MVVNNSKSHNSAGHDAAKRWASYAKAAGLGAFALGTVSTADAAIIEGGGKYNEASPAFDIVINPISYAYANRFDIDGDGTQDFRMGAGNYGTAFGFDTGDAGLILTSGSPASYAEAFAGGALIDGAAAGAGNFYGAEVLSNVSFSPGSSHFMGFKTSLGYFGWMEISLATVADAGGNGVADKRLTIHNWAYDNSGAGIAAGAGAVPEPGSLALLAAGSLGLLARRRRQNAA